MHLNKISFVALLAVALLGTAVVGCSNNEPMPGQRAGAFMDDSYLTTAVKTKLAANEGLKSFDIKVITDHQVVTLIGVVPTQALRDQAVSVAKSVRGVKGVVNNIEVKSGS
ncbi:MAG TPA: BON domain-containing protein [Gammaproteobacteria bacterium]|nr:BON domain-containing protein [Gammaproteobacteria bacterium]